MDITNQERPASSGPHHGGEPVVISVEKPCRRQHHQSDQRGFNSWMPACYCEEIQSVPVETGRRRGECQTSPQHEQQDKHANQAADFSGEQQWSRLAVNEPRDLQRLTKGDATGRGDPKKVINRRKGDALSNGDSSVCAFSPSMTITACQPIHRLAQCIEASDYVRERCFQDRTPMTKDLRPMEPEEVVVNRLGPDKRRHRKLAQALF